MTDAELRPRCQNGHQMEISQRFCTTCGLAAVPPADQAKPSRASSRRSPLAVFAAIGVGFVLLGVLAGALLTKDDGNARPAGQSSTTTTVGPGSSSTSSETKSDGGSADLERAASYYTTDGTKPTLSPNCNGLFSLCLNAPSERATALFGTEAERFEGSEPGSIVRAWNIADARVTIMADRVGSIMSITAAVEPESETRIALPGGLLLGEATMGDVVSMRGAPHDTESDTAENDYFHTYIYQGGPEGTDTLRYTHVSSGEPVADQALPARRVTSFSVAS